MWPQARTEGASPALLFLLHTAPSLGSRQALGSAGTHYRTVPHRALTRRLTGLRHGLTSTQAPPQHLQVPLALLWFSVSG